MSGEKKLQSEPFYAPCGKKLVSARVARAKVINHVEAHPLQKTKNKYCLSTKKK